MRLHRPSLLALLAVVACKDGDSVVTDTDTGPSVIGESGIFTDSGGAEATGRKILDCHDNAFPRPKRTLAQFCRKPVPGFRAFCRRSGKPG